MQSVPVCVLVVFFVVAMSAGFATVLQCLLWVFSSCFSLLLLAHMIMSSYCLSSTAHSSVLAVGSEIHLVVRGELLNV